jgi:beta-glucosidase
MKLSFPLVAILLAGVALTTAGAFSPLSKGAVEESYCPSCSLQATITGRVTHHKDLASLAIQGVEDAKKYREDVNGPRFTLAIPHLPAGEYTVRIGVAETVAKGAGERVFDVSSGDKTLVKDFDTLASAGATFRVAWITGSVSHEDDSLRGPLTLTFTASKGNAKFNTIEVKNSAGVSVFSVAASEIADAFSSDEARLPQVTEPMIWKDPSLPLKTRAGDLIRRMSLAEKVSQLKNDAPAIPRLGLTAYNYWNEALHGVANNGIATVFPEPVGGAATWNPELLRQEGRVVGIEGRAKFNDYATKHNGDSKWWTGLTFWAPNINIFRDPRWGRGQETYGEDPYLTGEMGVQFVKGMQGDDPKHMLAMACAKHYAVHSGPERDRHRFDATVSERDLYDTYLPQFERVVREGKVGGVMSAYNAVNGVPASASSLLLTDLLRRQWGFEGYVVSDCDAIRDIWGERQHRYVKTPEEAAAAAVKAGCDLCCGGDYNALVRAVQQGLITEKEIDGALYRTLWTRFRLGLFDPAEKVAYSKYTLADNDTPEHKKIALDVARQSLVLLKNDGTLPLDRTKLKRIAVIGPNANSRSMLEGNYHGSASSSISILTGIRQLAGPGVEVVFAQGSPITTKPGNAPYSGQDNTTTRPLPELAAEAVAAAKDADVIVYVGGITAGQEGESFDRESIELPEVQGSLVKALHATGKPMVLVNCSGSAMALPWETENLPAIMQAWYPGEEGGRAVAEALFGEINPSGHLPVTFYRSTADLPSFTEYSMKNRTYRYFEGKPLYAFGHGLSYTTFRYKGGRLASAKLTPKGVAKVSFTVDNNGKRDGDTVTQVYYRRLVEKEDGPRQSLCGFRRVGLKAGQPTRVTIEVPASRLRHWDSKTKRYVVDLGKYEFLIGNASDDIRQRLPFQIMAR